MNRRNILKGIVAGVTGFLAPNKIQAKELKTRNLSKKRMFKKVKFKNANPGDIYWSITRNASSAIGNKSNASVMVHKWEVVQIVKGDEEDQNKTNIKWLIANETAYQFNTKTNQLSIIFSGENVYYLLSYMNESYLTFEDALDSEIEKVKTELIELENAKNTLIGTLE